MCRLEDGVTVANVGSGSDTETTDLCRAGIRNVIAIQVRGCQHAVFIGARDHLLEDGVSDEEYLEALLPAVRAALDSCQPEILFYVGGADPYREDQLGGLTLSLQGLSARDAGVFEAAPQPSVSASVGVRKGRRPKAV